MAFHSKIHSRNRNIVLISIIGFTIFLGFQWQNIQLSNKERSVLPDDDPAIVKYGQFVKQFGQEDNAIVVGVNDASLFDKQNFDRWNRLSKQLASFPEITFAISLDNLQELKANKKEEKF